VINEKSVIDTLLYIIMEIDLRLNKEIDVFLRRNRIRL
jgi:hypothetical protein